ncbi:MAG: PadR family transcriptional regulator [Erysipelotrichaceae bacterium]
MNVQFKKGVLELIVLFVIKNEDKYGYQLVSEVDKAISVNEGTIYPLLKRLTLEHYCETYLQESNSGPSRKYYRITPLGKKYLDELTKEWLSFSQQVNEFIKKEDDDNE